MDDLLKHEYPRGDDGATMAPKLHVTDFWSEELAVDMLEKALEELGDGLKISKLSYRIVTSCHDK
ncbi:hypothetical protein F5Y13DRAFT_194207 [Hypoxylon sp. FL1857]|nr:hypothetical protein F5Y13DRAFT_194207 [Hypoxylon sp. FL1857]